MTSTALNPGISTSTLTPGTYTLQFKVKDSDGVQGSDQRLVTVLDKAAYGKIPTTDVGMEFYLTHTGSTTIRVNESLSLQPVISKGNPPFYYSWTYPQGVNYSPGPSPLEAVFTFPSPGHYWLSIFMKDTMYDNGGPDTWSGSVNVEVLP